MPERAKHVETTERKQQVVNISAVLKDLIRRLAKKEIKSETGKTRSAVAQYRRDIAKLKRQVAGQQREITFLKGQEEKRLAEPEVVEGPVEGARFSARSVRAQRKRLKMSAQQFAKLVGVSPLTVYNWEHEKSRPRQQQFAALVAVRELGRREASKKLDVLQAKVERAARCQSRRNWGPVSRRVGGHFSDGGQQVITVGSRTSEAAVITYWPPPRPRKWYPFIPRATAKEGNTP